MKKGDKAVDAASQAHLRKIKVEPRGRQKRTLGYTQVPREDGDTSQPGRLAWPIPEGAQRAGVSRSTIYKLSGQGKLRLIKIAGRRLIPESEIVRLVAGE